MIELIELSAGYPGRLILRNISLSFPPGKIIALLGPNGCGKSTLLRTVMGLQPKIEGEVLLSGQNIEHISPRQLAQKVAYLPQSRTIPNITALRMVLHGRFPYLPYPRRYRKEDYDIAWTSLYQVDAADLANISMQTLSGGQRQKVYLAMALAQDTETILMDEPTTYLDIRHQLDAMSIARRLANEGRAVVLVLHDLCLALRTADIIAVLENGQLQKVGTPNTIFESGVLDEVFQVSLQRTATVSGWQYYYG